MTGTTRLARILACTHLAACATTETPNVTLPLPSAFPSAIELPPNAPPVDLSPRVEMDAADRVGAPTAVVLPLPIDRVRLRRVDVFLSVTRRGDGKLANKQRAAFSRNTTGDALRFYLPPLPEGSYDAEVRAVALVDAVAKDGALSVEERTSRVVVPLTPLRTSPPSESIEELSFHFEFGLTRVVGGDRAAVGTTLKRLKDLAKDRRLIRAQVDCWASREGDARYNVELSERRCAWFKQTVWDQVPAARERPIELTPHGSGQLPMDEPVNAPWRTIETARRRNRVAVVRLVISG